MAEVAQFDEHAASRYPQPMRIGKVDDGSEVETGPTITGFADTVAHALDAGAELIEQAAAPALGLERYDIEAPLGEGGMGRVMQARDRQFGRRVAIKELLRKSSAALRARFQVEAVVTANLEHPGVPPVYERGVDGGGAPYYVMRLVKGRTLADAIEGATDLAARLKLVPVVARVAQTLAYAHEHGVVHRDVKPANVVVGRHGETVLLDWGIAKVRGVQAGDALLGTDGEDDAPIASNATRQGAVIGTPAYMAPEQAAGDIAAIDERTDVFALGALLYHVLSGQAPNSGPTSESQIERALAADYPSVLLREPKAPASLVAICSRAMARDPSDRFASAKELADALDGALTDALSGKGTQLVNAFAGLLSFALLGFAALSATIVWQLIPEFKALGWGVFPIIVLSTLGFVVGVIELLTKGRHQLASLLLTLIGLTFMSGILGTVMGLMQTLRAALEVKGKVEGWIVAEGSYESIGNLFAAAALCSGLIAIWGVARRRALRAEQR